jgi:hypothetical protein
MACLPLTVTTACILLCVLLSIVFILYIRDGYLWDVCYLHGQVEVTLACVAFCVGCFYAIAQMHLSP